MEHRWENGTALFSHLGKFYMENIVYARYDPEFQRKTLSFL
ncbi:hypothetical protein [Bacteroides acidifaciens]|nr:hypothetical protein [Bacteroides acidifaciens]